MSLDLRQSIQQDKHKMKDVNKRHQLWLGGFLTETNWSTMNKKNHSIEQVDNKQSKSEMQYLMSTQSAIFQPNKFIPFIHERDSVGRLIRKQDISDEDLGLDSDQDDYSQKKSRNHSSENRLDKSGLASQKNINISNQRTQSLNHLLFDTIIIPGQNGKKKQKVLMDDKRTFQRTNLLELNQKRDDDAQQNVQSQQQQQNINYTEFKIKTIQPNKFRETHSQMSPQQLSTKPNSQQSHVRGGGVKQPRLGFNDQYHDSKVPSIGYYNVTHNLIEPRVSGIIIRGKDKHFNKIKRATFEGSPHFLTYKQTDKYVQIPDFQKSLARSQTNYKWAPEIYQEEVNRIKELQKGFKLDNKQLESDYQFYIKMQKKYPVKQLQFSEEMPKAKMHQPPNKQEIKDLTKHTLQFTYQLFDIITKHLCMKIQQFNLTDLEPRV